MTRQEALRAFVDGVIVGVILGCLIGLVACAAHGQDTSGFYVAPDGSVTSWDAQSGYSGGQGGTSAWSPQGGYVASPDGSFGSWSGPVQPVVPSSPQTFVIVPDAPQQ